MMDSIDNILIEQGLLSASDSEWECAQLLRIPMLGIGTKEAYLAIRSDDQLENRFEPMVLPVWQEGKELESLLASFMELREDGQKLMGNI